MAVFSRHQRLWLWLLFLLLCFLGWGIHRLVPPVWVVIEGVGIYALVLCVIYCIFKAVRMQVRFMRNRRRRGVPAR